MTDCACYQCPEHRQPFGPPVLPQACPNCGNRFMFQNMGTMWSEAWECGRSFQSVSCTKCDYNLARDSEGEYHVKATKNRQSPGG